jgi:type IV fimbrial biogenesis protein FimT
MAAPRGFTLVELVTAMAVTAILVAVAMPSFRNFSANASVRTASYTMIGSLNLARSEAIKRNAIATVTPAGPGWAQGWTVSVAGQVLQQVPALRTGTTVAAGAPAAIAFDPNGRLSGFAGTAALTLAAAAGGASAQRCVTVGVEGMPKTALGACP